MALAEQIKSRRKTKGWTQAQLSERLGLYLARVMGTNVLPNEPVPPVIRIEELVSIYGGRLQFAPNNYKTGNAEAHKFKLKMHCSPISEPNSQFKEGFSFPEGCVG